MVAYGQKLGNDILQMARFYVLNIHPSLLPKYRGPEPVARAILNGDPFAGVCIVKVVEKMDAGPVLGITRVPVPPSKGGRQSKGGAPGGEWRKGGGAPGGEWRKGDRATGGATRKFRKKAAEDE